MFILSILAVLFHLGRTDNERERHTQRLKRNIVKSEPPPNEIKACDSIVSLVTAGNKNKSRTAAQSFVHPRRFLSLKQRKPKDLIAVTA